MENLKTTNEELKTKVNLFMEKLKDVSKICFVICY